MVGKCRSINWHGFQFLDSNAGITVEFNSRQFVGHGQKIDRFTQVLAHFTPDSARIFDNRLHVTVFSNPFCGSLGPHFRHTGDVVRSIPHECQIVDNLIRTYLEFFNNPGLIHKMIVHGVDQADIGIDQLRHILVTG